MDEAGLPSATAHAQAEPTGDAVVAEEEDAAVVEDRKMEVDGAAYAGEIKLAHTHRHVRRAAAAGIAARKREQPTRVAQVQRQPRTTINAAPRINRAYGREDHARDRLHTQRHSALTNTSCWHHHEGARARRNEVRGRM